MGPGMSVKSYVTNDGKAVHEHDLGHEHGHDDVAGEHKHLVTSAQVRTYYHIIVIVPYNVSFIILYNTLSSHYDTHNYNAPSHHTV